MRSEQELREQLEKFRVQSINYMRAQEGIEAYATLLVCSVLSYALGDASSPTIRFDPKPRR